MSDDKDNQSIKSQSDGDEEYDKPLIPGPWVKEHTEETIREIENLQIKQRPLIKMQFIKKRKEFGKGYKLNEADANEKMQDIKQTQDPFNTQKSKVIDIGLQGCNKQVNTAAQTIWNRKINKIVTVEDETQVLDIPEDNPDLLRFIQDVQYEIEQALQSNETIDIFQNDFDLLAKDDLNFGTDSELSTQIKEWKSFFYNSCRGKKITSIQFQPVTNQHKSKFIAASFIENLNFEERIAYSYKSHKNMIVLWDYEDQHSIDPVMILVSPLEIMCFAFNPKDPTQIVAGAINGQILMWDLKQSDKVSGFPTSKKSNKAKQEKSELVELQPVLMSQLQDPQGASSSAAGTDAIRKNIPSHKNPVLCLQWLPNTIMLDKRSIYNLQTPPANEVNHQFATISCDGQILIWDNKFLDNKQKVITDLSNISWRAMYGIQLFRPQGGGQMGGAQISFRKNQKTPTLTGTSDEGEVYFLDWAQKQSEEGDKAEMVQQIWQQQRNYRPSVGLDVSPFFQDIILSLHDFNFCIWKQGVDVPIFESNILKGAQITCGCFSPSRPGVIVIGRTDGQLDIWDFLDQSHKATMQYLVVSKMLTCIKFNEQHLNNLAVGDIEGSLHIIEFPTTLCRKLGDEDKTMEEFWDREVQKIFKDDKQNKEKLQAEKDGKPKEEETKENYEDQLEREYQAFAQQYISEVINKEVKEPEDDKAKSSQQNKK